MQVRSTAAKLRSALETAKTATPANAVLLAHAGVSLCADQDGLVTFTGSDGDTTVAATVDAHVDDPGETLVLPRPLAAFLAALPATAPVQLRTDGPFLVVERSGAREYRFATLSASRLAPAGAAEFSPASTGSLAGAAAAVRAAAGRDGAVRVGPGDGHVWFAATDSYRLSKVTVDGMDLGGFDGTLALASLELLAKHEFSKVAATGSSLTLASDALSVQVRLLAVSFPGVDRVLDTSGCTSVSSPMAPWRDALRRLEAVSTAASTHVQLTGDADTVELSVSGAEAGSGAEVVPVSGDATGLSVALRVGYLVDALASVRSDEFTLAWHGSDRPVHVQLQAGPARAHHVVMPVRV